jgi:hypothetical protein
VDIPSCDVEPNKVCCRPCREVPVTMFVAATLGFSEFTTVFTDSSAKRDRCLSVPFIVFSRRKRGRNLDGSQGSFMSVKIRIPALKVSVSATPSSSLLLWPGLVRRFHPIVSTRVGASQPLGDSDGIFLF